MFLLGTARRATRSLIRISARQAPESVNGATALVVAPHPDDETLGCGGTILRKLDAGTHVSVLVVTDGSRSHESANLSPMELARIRTDEMAEAAARLGIAPQDLYKANLPDGEVSMYEDALVAVLADLMVALDPAEVYTTSVWEPHPDHSATGRAVRRAVRRSGSRATILEYAIWLWGSWPAAPRNRWGSIVDAMELILRRQAVAVGIAAVIERKFAALSAHESQLRRPAAVPEGEDWPTLPPDVLQTAAHRHELFLRVSG